MKVTPLKYVTIEIIKNVFTKPTIGINMRWKG